MKLRVIATCSGFALLSGIFGFWIGGRSAAYRECHAAFPIHFAMYQSGLLNKRDTETVKIHTWAAFSGIVESGPIERAIFLIQFPRKGPTRIPSDKEIDDLLSLYEHQFATGVPDRDRLAETVRNLDLFIPAPFGHNEPSGPHRVGPGIEHPN